MANSISQAVERVDNRAKASGQTRYLADIPREGVLHGRFFRSDRARARILDISLPPVPADCRVLSCGDVPGLNVVSFLVDDWPVFAGKMVEHVGEPILLVVGPDVEVLADVVAGITVAYEDLPPVLTIDDSRCTPQAGFDFTTGDPKAAFAAADRIISGEYKTGSQEHVYLEPQGMLAIPRQDGITLQGSMQCPFFVRRAVHRVLGLPLEKVQVVQTPTGGAFGGKEDYPSVLACQAAVAATVTGSPVLLVLERDEDIQVTCKRHPSRILVRTAHDSAGRPTAMDVDITLDGGAYTGLSPVVLQRAMFVAGGVYNIENIRCRGRVLATNTVVAGAFRGFGGPQGIFAVEMHMDQVARELGISPLEYKRTHLVRTGDQTATGGRYHSRVVIDQIADRLEKLSGFEEKFKTLGRRPGEPGVTDQEAPLRGIGQALVLHGAGFTGSAERDVIRSTVKLERDDAGRVTILVSNVEMGQGLQTTMRKIVARVLDLTLDEIDFPDPDTDRVPDSGPTVASRSIMIVGKLVERAAEDLKRRRDEPGTISAVQHYRQPSHIQWDNETLTGDAYPDYSWGGVAVQVAIDPLTGVVTTEKVWAVHDVGTPIDEMIVQGQVEGGILQGLGWASLEVLEFEEGRLRQGTLTDYTIPTAFDAPPIVSELMDNPSAVGPFGAKGAGEVTFVGVPAAFASAVGHALGVPVTELPIRPEHVLDLLEGLL
ncbi:MAG: xanthine dehydrogenase family protein [Candidatus Krumholzibacteria bacterium]|nr:xanthine dehydrogenase family protein [Candidatus Krumholzibacteria bacterium]